MKPAHPWSEGSEDGLIQDIETAMTTKGVNVWVSCFVDPINPCDQIVTGTVQDDEDTVLLEVYEAVCVGDAPTIQGEGEVLVSELARRIDAALDRKKMLGAMGVTT